MSPKNQNMHVGFRKVWKKLGAGFNMKRKQKLRILPCTQSFLNFKEEKNIELTYQ